MIKNLLCSFFANKRKNTKPKHKKTVYTIKYKPQIKCIRIYIKNFEKDF